MVGETGCGQGGPSHSPLFADSMQPQPRDGSRSGARSASRRDAVSARLWSFERFSTFVPSAPRAAGEVRMLKSAVSLL